MTFSWGLVGPGGISRRFADALHAVPDARLAAVWGRDAVRAAEFARRSGDHPQTRLTVHAQLETMLVDPTLDAVYIATPHDSHAHYAHACLVAGKPVLCEKPLTPCVAQTLPLLELAQARNVFLMEALWTRLLPLYGQVRRWLQDGAVGELRLMDSSFCFETPYLPHSRLFSPDRAGGALLDIGIYNLAVTRLAMEAAYGRCPEPMALQVHASLAPTGVDLCVEAELRFPTGTVSRFICAFDRRADNTFRIEGTLGTISIESNFWEATRARLQRFGQATEVVELPFRANGFEYEIEEAMRAVRAGWVQSPAMPHAESLALAAWLDALRSRVGVRYPFEAPAVDLSP